MEQNKEESFICNKCFQPCSKGCMNCRKVHYCGVRCQRKDWKRHKHNCYPFIRDVNCLKRKQRVTYFATRDINQGENILVESPLISGPILPLKSDGSEMRQLICLGCCESGENVKPCSDCGWYSCGCILMADHKEAECKIFSTKNIPTFRPIGHRKHYDYIRYIRELLLRDQNLPLWNRLMELYYDSTNIPSNHPLLTSKEEKDVNKFIKETCEMDIEDEMIHKVIQIDTLMGSVKLNSNRHSIFEIHSTMQHSCIPNVYAFEIQLDKNGLLLPPNSMLHIAAVEIKKGERLTLAGGVWLDGETAIRRNLIHKELGFWCSCLRCSDPTELGTFYSSMRCKICPRGLMVAENPLSNNSRWSCNSCRYSLSADEYTFETDFPFDDRIILEGHSNNHGLTILNIRMADVTPEKLMILSQLDKFLYKYSDDYHPNYVELYRIQQIVLNGLVNLLITHRPATTNVKVREERLRLVNKMQDLATNCYSVAKVLHRGISFHRVKSIFMLNLSQWLRLQELVICGGGNKEVISLAKATMELHKEFEEMCGIFQEYKSKDKSILKTWMDYVVMRVKMVSLTNAVFGLELLDILND